MRNREALYWKVKLEILRKYDASADVYDVLYRDEQEEKIKSALESVQLGEQNIVLDLGCGTGLLFGHMEASVRFIVGLDISRGLLKRALPRSKVSSRVSLIRGDVDYLPLRDEVFDKVFAITLLQNVSDIEATLQEAARTTKENAILVLTGLKKSFKKDQFFRLLRRSGLDVIGVKDENLREFVVTCGKKEQI